MSEYNQKPWYRKESEVGPEKAQRKLQWCDECKYYHGHPNECEYIQPQLPIVYYDPSITNAPQ